MNKQEKNNRVCEGLYELKIMVHTGPIPDYVFLYWYDVQARTGNEAIDKLKDRILTLAKKKDRKGLADMHFPDAVIDRLLIQGHNFVKFWEFIVLMYPDYYDYLKDKD